MARKKVLLVDDQNTVLMMERMMLKEAGYEIVTARNGTEAVEKALAERPDLILLDVVMPKMDGFEVCRTLRAHEAMKVVPIVMCTTRGEATNRQAGYDAGCNDYVTKPFNAVELLAKLQGYLAK
jgi:DNA-binding response OmpR family regulator